MGKPVYWDYSLVISPGEHGTAVRLYRIQRGTDTRFLWSEATTNDTIPRREVDAILQGMYTAVLALMEATV
jgi:hypothetical protein